MIDTKLAPYGAFVLRIALGVMFLAHAYLKIGIFGIAGFEGFLAQTGFPTALAWPIILGEAIGGIAILLGVYARVFSVALLPVLLGAVVVHSGNGWLFTAANGGWEYPAFLALTALAQALIGDGAFAVRPLSSVSGAPAYAGRAA
jgi:putative oxidoreductase